MAPVKTKPQDGLEKSKADHSSNLNVHAALVLLGQAFKLMTRTGIPLDLTNTLTDENSVVWTAHADFRKNGVLLERKTNAFGVGTPETTSKFYPLEDLTTITFGGDN